MLTKLFMCIVCTLPLVTSATASEVESQKNNEFVYQANEEIILSTEEIFSFSTQIESQPVDVYAFSLSDDEQNLGFLSDEEEEVFASQIQSEEVTSTLHACTEENDPQMFA